MGLSLIEGNEAIAWGAYHAGCRFFAGYPITPATSVFNTMLRLLPPAGGIVLQGEDEIASMGYCIGAAMAGMKVMTATSGPGLSLYSEQISYAYGSEIPMVIVNVQRLGPSTGSATRGADGDVMFMRWNSSGGLPAVVLAPTSAADGYTLTRHAFNVAEKLRCPVFVASNKEIGLTRETLDFAALEKPAIEERAYNPAGQPYVPFRADAQTLVPPFLPLGGEVLSRQTSSTHGENAYITTDPKEIGAIIDRMAEKIDSRVDEFTYYDLIETPGADTLILTYGVTARAARDSVRRLAEKGRPVSLLVLKTLWPSPQALIREKTREYKRILMVEMNLGQYVLEVQRILGGRTVDFLGFMNGQLITPGQIEEAVLHG
jgi:2-oxoglutarate ferredoxin oxidoreductase subunit alpha